MPWMAEVLKVTVNRSDGTAWAYTVMPKSTDGFGVFANGNLGASGLKTAVVNTADYGWRKYIRWKARMCCSRMSIPLSWSMARQLVTFDPVFAETVNPNDPYQVFLSPHGDCGLYVAETTPTSFTVHALGGQTCSLAFDYRIIARRLGYENVRLSTAEDPTSELQGMPQESAPSSNGQP